MLHTTNRARNFLSRVTMKGVSSKTLIQNDCLMRFYDADTELKAISNELDSFDGKKDPIRCNLLVNRLRTSQDKVISLLFQLMDQCNCDRASRDYRMKFPDEILLSEGSESLNGQIWFGAECLSAGSNILNHTKESAMLRPMAKHLTAHLDSLRNDLRDLVIDGGGLSRINQELIHKMSAFDHIFAQFEYEYVRIMLPIRTIAEIEKLQDVAVLFSETLIDSVQRSLICQDDIDEFQPIVMIAIPRLAIVRGLLYKYESPIYTRRKSQMCSLFQPFHGPLHSIRRLLRKLSNHEVFILEKMLCDDQTAIESPFDYLNGPQLVGYEESTQVSEPTVQPKKNSVDYTNGEASTSNNNYTNVLRNGLSYPVGHKSTENPLDHNRENYLDDKPCSSKKIPNESEGCGSDSYTKSSSSSVSSYENILTGRSSRSTNDSKPNLKVDIDDADEQLSRLIGDLQSTEPVRSDLPTSQEDNVTTNPENVHEHDSNNKLPQTHEAISPTPDSTKGQQNCSLTSRDQLLRELFVKQTRQLLHKLFVAISGVADQLQSNFASDLRFILRHIFISEIEGDQNEQNLVSSDSDNDHSDASLPIEQAFEAREATNLTDLASTYGFEINQEIDGGYQSASATQNSGRNQLYATETDVHQNETSNPSVGIQPVSLNEEPSIISVNQENMGSLRSSNGEVRPGLFYPPRSSNRRDQDYHVISPNHPSPMSSQHIQNVIQHQQQQIRDLSREARVTARLNSDQPNVGEVLNNMVTERRNRQSNSRSRRPRVPPAWVPDEHAMACTSCNITFTWFRRRHHCRICGQIFCSECSRFQMILHCWGYNGPVRVCECCFSSP